MIISWDKLEEVTGRKKPILALLSKTLLEAHEPSEDGIEFDKALQLLVKVGSFAGSQHSEVLAISQKLADEKAEKLQYAVALEMVKTERQHLVSQMDDLKRQSQSHERRAQQAEARLHEVTQSFAYLIERQSRRANGADLPAPRKLPTLLLTNPIKP